jgi:hypothetical protein
VDTISFEDTKNLIDLILSRPLEVARQDLHLSLVRLNLTEGQFYAGIIKHAPAMRLTTDSWFELLCRLPNRILRSDLDLRGLLSEEQLKRLPPITG